MATFQDRYQKLISELGRSGSLRQWIAQGKPPDEVKEIVVKLLSPYFENTQRVEEYATSFLLPEVENLLLIAEDSWALDKFEKCLAIHRAAKAVDADASMVACAEWLSPTAQGLSHYWSMFNTERDKNTLPMPEFVLECQQNMGLLLEAALKPYLQELLHQLRISRAKKPTVSQLQSLKLGNIVQELIDTSGVSELFRPPPQAVPLHQWRNMAQHYSDIVDENHATFSYETASGSVQIVLSRDELLDVLKKLKMVYAAIRLASTVSFMDNLPEVRATGLVPQQVNIRPEMQLLNFGLGLASQGFELIDATWDNTEAIAVIREATNNEPDVRRGHASQFAVVLWQHIKAPKATIIYLEKDGTANMRFSVREEDCIKVENGELEFHALGNRVEMVNLKTGNIIAPLPDDAV